MSALTELKGEWTIDPAHSEIGFVVRHAMVTKVRGAFNEFQGSIKGEGLQDAQVELAIEVNSIDTRNSQRDEHLRTADFFELEKYPQITFRSTALNRTGDDTFDLTGDLTVKGVTRSVTVPFEFEGVATDPFGSERAGFSGSTVVNRTDFGLTWNAALETGGVMLSDKVTLQFEISAVRNA